uniref:DUF4346 domain-containing protein n=1 Tax=Inkyuleea mariana TaxID=123988 RepID=A0A4D6WZU1_9FLOR|nr:hypothetical protein [Inkyuleea mariana]
MDNFYCLIRVIVHKKRKLSLYYFSHNITKQSFIYPICFTASNINVMFKLLSMHNCFNQASIYHILYIGQELYKAELCLAFNQIYIQE